MNLQQFVTEIIDSVGGIAEPVEYALCNVMVPEKYAYIMGGRTECLLAFDYEVVLENPDADFVNFGGYIADNCIELALSRTTTNIQYIDVDRLVPINVIDKIRKQFDLREKIGITLEDEKTAFKPWLVLHFRTNYLSDEKKVGFRTVWVDTNRLTISDDMEKSVMFYSRKPDNIYPLLHIPDYAGAIINAYDYMLAEAKKIAGSLTNSHGLDIDLKRINNYYDELVAETHVIMQRKSLTQEQINDYEQRINTYQIERKRQLMEIKNKHTYRAEISLDHGIVYYLPVVAYQFQVNGSEGLKNLDVYYNPVLRTFSTF